MATDRPPPATWRRGAKLRRLVSTVAAATSGSVVYAVLQAVTLAIITRKGEADDTGLFLLAQGIATPIALLTGMRLRDQIATASTVGLSLPYTRRQLHLTIPAAVLGSAGWALATSSSNATVGALILIANLSQAHVWTIQGGLLRDQRFSLSSYLDAVLGVLSVAAVAVGYAMGGLAHASAALAVSWFVAAVASVFWWGSGSFSAPLTSTMASDLRMGSSSMGAVAQISAGRVGTYVFLSPAALGRLGTGSFLIRTAQPLVRGLLRINAPRLANARSEGEAVIARLEHRLIRGSAVVSIAATPIFAAAGFYFGPRAIALLFDDSVVATPATYAVLLGAAPALFASMLLSQILVARRDSVSVLWVSVAALAATVATIYPFARMWGEPGAALAIGIGYLVRCIVAVALLTRTPTLKSHPIAQEIQSVPTKGMLS